MKKLLLLVIAIAMLQVAKAQDVEIANKFIVGGSINFVTHNNIDSPPNLSVYPGIGGIYANNTNDTKYTNFAITPYIGKELNSRLFVGLQFDFRLGKFKADDIFVVDPPNSVDIERNSNQFGIEIFTRHILNPDNKLNFFIQPYLGYNLLNEELLQNSNVTQEEKANYFEIGAGLGILYNINSRIRATLRTGGINYINGKWEIKDTDTEKDFSSFDTTLNLSNISLGFEIRM